MLKLFKSALVCMAGALFVILAVACTYMATALVGALVTPSATPPIATNQSPRVHIKLLTSFLHADIAIKVDAAIKQRFAFLAQAGVPMDHPNLEYLAFGWGSKAFYTTAGSYSDITLSATYRAIMGDDSVMHIAPTGALPKGPDLIDIALSEAQFERLLAAIESGFKRGGDGHPIHLVQFSHGYGDVFYEGVGGFNIFYPCNEWVAATLKASGITLGAWTPTTHALKLSLAFWKNEGR